MNFIDLHEKSIRSFELENSTKPFAGLFIFKGNKKPIIISNNKFLNRIVKIKNKFHVMTEKTFTNYINIYLVLLRNTSGGDK